MKYIRKGALKLFDIMTTACALVIALISMLIVLLGGQSVDGVYFIMMALFIIVAKVDVKKFAKYSEREA